MNFFRKVEKNFIFNTENLPKVGTSIYHTKEQDLLISALFSDSQVMTAFRNESVKNLSLQTIANASFVSKMAARSTSSA